MRSYFWGADIVRDNQLLFVFLAGNTRPLEAFLETLNVKYFPIGNCRSVYV